MRPKENFKMLKSDCLEIITFYASATDLHQLRIH